MLRTRAVWTGVAGSPYYSTFYWNGTGPTIANQAQDATIQWALELGPFLNAELSIQIDSEVLEINEATGVIVTAWDVGGSTTACVNPGDPLPVQTQCRTDFGTTAFRAGRRVVGRSFLPGMLEVHNDSGLGPIEVVRETFQGIYQTELGGSSAQHVVWSRPVEGGPAGETSPVTSYRASAVWSTLRSRRAA